jgi:heme-degrading monooxygenase HmoA
MAVLELTLLRLKHGVNHTDATLLSNLRAIRAEIKTNSRFYHCTEDPSLLYILGLWPSQEAHNNFLASADRARILGPQEQQTEFLWGIHAELDSMQSLPLTARVLAISRQVVRPESVEKYDEIMATEEKIIQDATALYPVVRVWRIDAEKGKHEALIFTGWNSVDEHVEFMEANKNKESTELILVEETKHGLDLESHEDIASES